MKSVKNIVVLGSTGSIGKNTLEVIERNPEMFNVIGLSAGTNAELLIEQIRKFKPSIVAVNNHSAAMEIKKECFVKGIKVCSGVDGIIEVATLPKADLVISAIVGAAGLLPTYSAIKAGKDIGLANKESLVMAGGPLMKEALVKKINIIPIDSEQSAICQCLSGSSRSRIKKIILTSSGGPFRNLPDNELADVKVEDALKHPHWNMGNKITIDAATMMNKGLEVIEARWLFGVKPEFIEIMIHPEGVIHSMIEFIDSSIMAQFGPADMRVPISYALNYGKRIDGEFESIDLIKIGKLSFEKPNFEKFPCLKYAYEAVEKGGTLPAVLNAANEVAVHAFIDKQIPFTAISETIKRVMDKHEIRDLNTVYDAIKIDKWGRETAKEIVSEIKNEKSETLAVSL